MTPMLMTQRKLPNILQSITNENDTTNRKSPTTKVILNIITMFADCVQNYW